MLTSRIREVIEKTGFNREKPHLYILTSIIAPFEAITILMLMNIAVSSQNMEVIESSIRLSHFAVLMLGYVLGSTYLSYRATKLVKEHLFLSNLSTYAYAREKDDRERLLALFKSSLARSEIPSPITSLILNIITLGLFFPILLHILESNIRKHARSEETLFYNKSLTRETGFSTLLLDLSALLVTLFIYMIPRVLRFVRVFNKHVDTVHTGVKQYPYTQETIIEKPIESPLLGIALILLTISIHSLLSLINISLIAGIGYVLALPALYTVYTLRNASIYKQIIVAYMIIYLILCSTILIGYIHSNASVPMAESFYKSTRDIYEKFGTDVSSYFEYIFMNNFVISASSIVSTINPVLLFHAIANAGVILGGLSFKLVVEKGLQTIIAMLLFLVWPHVLLELLSYGIFLVLAVNIDNWNWRRILIFFSTALLILIVAAFVESLTIVIGVLITQRY